MCFSGNHRLSVHCKWKRDECLLPEIEDFGRYYAVLEHIFYAGVKVCTVCVIFIFFLSENLTCANLDNLPLSLIPLGKLSRCCLCPCILLLSDAVSRCFGVGVDKNGHKPGGDAICVEL